MNEDLILDAFEKIDDKYIIEAKERGFMNSAPLYLSLPSSHRWRSVALLRMNMACLTHGCKNRLLIQSKPYKVQLKDKLRRNTL